MKRNKFILGFAILFVSVIVFSRQVDVTQALYENRNIDRRTANQKFSAPASEQFSASCYPPETTFLPKDTENLPNPAYLESVYDSIFDVKIRRITDDVVFTAYGNDYGYTDYHPVQPYPKNQAWNSDGTYLRVENTLLDGETYEIVKDIEGHIFERKWSYTNPNYIYGLSYDDDNFYFVRQDVKTPEYVNVEKLKSFSRATYDAVYMGPWEGNISFDDTLVALSAKKNNDLIIILYNIQTNTILKAKTFSDIWDRLDWVSISPLGNYVLMNWVDSGTGESVIDQYDLDLNLVRRLSQQGEHGDMGVDENGNEVYVQFEFYRVSTGDRRGIWSYRLDDGSEIEILSEKYGGGHVSCRNYRHPGWCFLTTGDPDFREVFALKLDGSETVIRFGKSRTQNEAEGAQGAPNPDGTKVVFKSDWGNVGAELDVYIAEKNLPVPSNDNFANATDLALGDSKHINTCLATSEDNDPIIPDCNLGKGQATVWYKYTPPANSAISLDTTGAKYDTFIAVWTGTGLGDLTSVACNNDTGDTLQSAVAFEVDANTTYYIEVGEIGEVWHPPLGSTFSWQFGDPINTGYNVDIYDVDAFDTSASLVADLHAEGRKAVCYISVGSWENWRPDAGDFPAEVIGNDYDGWAGEKWLDIRQIDTLAPIMRARLDMCAEKGFDGVEPDNIALHWEDTGFPISYADQLAYNIWLSEEAHSRGLSIGLKNNEDQVGDLLSYFDWALTEGCFYGNWCNDVHPFIDAGKPVFSAEYTDNTTSAQFQSTVCPQAQTLGFYAFLKNRDLDAYREDCP